jgi:hypothetical protein
MTPAAPQFPSLNVWEGMSEPEQDALIDRIERARRRKMLWSRIQAGVMWAAAAVCLGGLVYLAAIGT